MKPGLQMGSGSDVRFRAIPSRLIRSPCDPPGSPSLVVSSVLYLILGKGLGEVVSEIKGKPRPFHHEGRIMMMIIRANIYTTVYRIADLMFSALRGL